MIFTSQLGTKPSSLTPPLAPLTPLSHTKAKSLRPRGPENESIRTVRQGKGKIVCESDGAGSVDGGGVESKRV